MSIDTAGTKLAALAITATEAITAMMSAEAFQAWVSTAKKFYKYSFMNQLLIVAQNPEATHVAGFHKWLELQRCVRKGERGIAIYAPMLVKDQLNPDEKVMRFRVAHVFDISQTEGEPLPEGPDPLMMEAGENLEHYDNKLRDFLAISGLTLEYKPVLGSANGYYAPMTKKIVIDSELPPAQQFKTLLHEAAHYLADHRKEKAEEAEVVAETAAYLAAAYIDFDTSQYSVAYIAGWAKDVELFKAHLNTAHVIAQKLANAITADLT